MTETHKFAPQMRPPAGKYMTLVCIRDRLRVEDRNAPTPHQPYNNKKT